MAGTSNEPLLTLSIAVHSNPGVYALLVGSGVSSAAGIPTGWEIVDDLIQKIAAADGQDPPSDPKTWYQDRFDELPEYTKVVARLATTTTERRGLLRGYFEPTEDEREQGLKVPTAAHRAIARLVNLGYIRMILTTNFDRLIEIALVDEGIASDVVSSDDDLRGVVPHVHSRSMVVKLHGDYLDTRIKNTSRELAKYSKTLNEFLDRVFDEFGLIVCGWSGEWDTALASAILRCPTRRFTTYWLARGELTESAKRIIGQRRAEVVRIESADTAYSGLLQKIESLRDLNRPHPISTDVAVATVKRYLAETRFRIPMEEVFRDETERAYGELASERFTSYASGGLAKEEFQRRMQEYEAVVERLTAMTAALSYYDEGPNAHLLTRAVERLVDFPLDSGVIALLNLRFYPALLVAYAGGIASIAGKRYHNLAAILRDPQYREQHRAPKKPALDVLNAPSVFSNASEWIPRPREREFTPASNHLADLLRPVLIPYLPAMSEYDDTFNTFEYLLALTYLDLTVGEVGPASWSPIGRFGWQWRDDRQHAPWHEFMREGLERWPDWDLARAGFFGGASSRAKAIIDMHGVWLREATKRWH